MDQAVFAALEERLGREYLGQRLRFQVDHSASWFGHGYGGFHWENLEFLPWILEKFLKVLGCYQRGLRNAQQYRLMHVTAPLPRLPREFDGFTILHLSDLHVDAWPDQGQRLIDHIKGLTFDLAVITGDYRFLTFGDYGPVAAPMAALLEALACAGGVVGILGNHDFIEKVPLLERLGLRILVNEALVLRRGQANLWLIGLDDPHFYGLHDFAKAMAAIPPQEAKILLVHSPELITRAAQAGIDYYLCGHTHGGQICLPRGIPIFFNARCRRRYSRGGWQYHGMLGYTSRGTGSSGLPVRFCCPPELTLHRLVVPAAG
ncbi:MAG: metallophosphoesterase [Desulfobacca sp.]|uniref:metallophosphoesterase n=1 Tax=Desulfobacca sp. TaxID=2067990 RepID=UPI00404A55C5